MRKSLVAILVLSAASANATIIPAKYVGLSSGGNVDNAIAQQSASIAGLGSDVVRLDNRDAQLAADIHTVHMNTLTKYSESWGLEDRANIAALQESKVDKAVFTADQQRQDDHINAVQNAAQIANEKGDAGAVRMDSIEQRATVTDDRSINNAVRLDGVEGGVRETNTQLTNDRAATSARFTEEQRARSTADANLAAGVSQAQSTGDYAHSRIDAANANIDANRRASVATNRIVSQHTAQLADHEQRIGALEAQTNSNFANMDKRIDENKRHANAGISGVAAMASIPQVTEYQTFAVGAGVGTRSGENAIAVGFSARASQNVVLKASVAGDSQQSWTVGAGMSYGW